MEIIGKHKTKLRHFFFVVGCSVYLMIFSLYIEYYIKSTHGLYKHITEFLGFYFICLHSDLNYVGAVVVIANDVWRF